MRHWLEVIACHNLGSKKQWVHLQAVWDRQQGLCAYTGVPLVPGVNASVDHKTPLAKDGANSVDNLQWILMPINTAKRDLTDGEFVGLCCLIAKGVPRKVAQKCSQMWLATLDSYIWPWRQKAKKAEGRA